MIPLKTRLSSLLPGLRLIAATGRAAFFPRDPAYLVWFATHRCNARCSFCFNRENQEKAESGQELSLSEVEMICHRVAVLDRGKVIAQGPLSEIVPFEGALTVVASKVPEKVVAKLQELGVSVSRESGNLVIRGIDNKTIYQLLAGLGANGCELVEVRPQKQTLEDFFVNTITQKEMETEE